MVFTAVTMKGSSPMFRDMTPCGPVEVYWGLGRKYYLHLQVDCPGYSSTLKTEALSSSEMSIAFNHTIRYHMQKIEFCKDFNDYRFVINLTTIMLGTVHYLR
jgi:hypothetical protein